MGKLAKWVLWVLFLVAVLAFASVNGGPATAPAGPAAPVPAVDTTSTITPLPECPDNDDQCELARVMKALSTPVPGEDELIAEINTKYGPAGQLPGESGASWCHRQRLRTLMAGGGDPETIRQMGCQADGVNYPDPVLSPDAADDWH